MIEANKSFYQYWMLLCGVAFGVGELQFLRQGNILDARVFFPFLLSGGFLMAVLMKKSSVLSSGEKAVALERRHLHILADYLCVIGATALFSMLAYMVMNDVRFFEQEWSLSRFSFAIIGNLAIFGVGMALLSHLAGEERGRLP